MPRHKTGLAHDGQKWKKKMKKINFGMSLLAVAVSASLLLSPVKAYANSVTLTLETAPTSYGGDNVYPYNFSVNSSTSTIPLMCIDFYNHIDFGETWTATIGTISTTADEEAAWLFNDANIALKANNTLQAEDDQWAAWKAINSAVTLPDGGSATQLADAVAAIAVEPASFYKNFVIYTPVAGSWPSSEGTSPQDFIGYAPTPEPTSLILLGTGMLGLAGFWYRRNRKSIA